MLLVYSNTITPRLRYTFDLIIRELLGLEFRITASREEYGAYDGPRIIYGEDAAEGELVIGSHGLLFEKGIRDVEEEVFEYGGSPVFCKVYDKNATLPFDLFSAAFFMVSRYEEYLPYKRDEHGRFSALESFAFKNDFLDKPVVHSWAAMLLKILRTKYPGLEHKPSSYAFVPTYDIDSAYAYRMKGILRNLGGYALSLRNLDFDKIRERSLVLSGIEDDPFDTFSWQLNLQKKYDLKPLYFILLGRYGKFDKNISPSHPGFRKLLKSLADYAEMGIHPSYASNDDPGLLKQEVALLSDILRRETTLSRQHFLKLALPSTYQHLVAAGIKEDHSMGFAARSGFRSGLCRPFSFYDLDLESETGLRVNPFTLMDGTLMDYLHLGPEDAWNKITSLIDEVKAVDGIFVSLWHNESLSDKGRWAGWKELYHSLVKYAINK